MNEITYTFENSSGKTETRTFQIVLRSATDREQRMDLISNGFVAVTRENWENDDDYRVEKLAALACGINHGEPFMVKFW